MTKAKAKTDYSPLLDRSGPGRGMTEENKQIAFKILDHVKAKPGIQNVELAHEMGLSAKAVYKASIALVIKGLLRLESDFSHRRVYYPTPTLDEFKG